MLQNHFELHFKFIMKNTTKKIYFCIDYEEWFHIPYLFKYNFQRDKYETFSDKIIPFMKWLQDEGIVANVFVVGDIAKERSDTLKEMVKMGHEIGCHSYSHHALNKMSNEQFVDDTLNAKTTIEEAICHKIVGYRAPYFSMSEEKLLLLKDLGFKYDSSYIQSNANEYYNVMNLSNYNKVDSLVYEKNGFFEYEIPTLKNKPIAGGGFFRLYPFFLFKRYVKKFSKNEGNFVFFIHPFEIAGSIPFSGLKKMKLKDKIRFQLGRKTVEKKLKKAILFFKEQGYTFSKFGD